ncbi:hypothetical protein Mal4_58880 [Maioricimonas rarisocia]|uniref:Uncharacterized protein n=1 Tax=Maioricimonas rarisocia TaxID=2528026 RepID=A0A517ZGB6_9PLAN|nr:hypothetical protein [Maioricimonas rarisocia]QDU41520.1 hypothetical protein Mal4_58880 [Maioricimonas rarisocia]
MPIKFRCPHCRQFLGISRNRAGALADCPTCGRTIRVPNLDGKVDPLPDPELDLEDQQLKNALAALAGIDDEDDAGAGRSSAGTASGIAAAPVARRQEPAAREVPVAATPEEVVPSIATKPPPAQRPPERAGERNVPESDALDRLAKLADESGVRERSREPEPKSVMRPGSGLLATGGIALFVLGLVVGRLTAPTATAVAVDEPAGNGAGANRANVEQPDPDVPPAAVERELALTGRVTYLTADGQTRPDEGARVLVLPEERSGSSRLPVVGFRVGAAEVDVRLARAALRELGGDFTVADSEGRYEIRLPDAGNYDVLMISRYQPRDADLPLTDSVEQLLPVWFDRPSQLIGQVQYRLSSLLYRGEVPATRDHTFERL